MKPFTALSLLQTEPLQVQSSHLSFQEYFAACALCEGTRLSGAPPWQWPPWWGNTLTLGAEMGEAFGIGLRRAAGVEGSTLDLSRKLGGDRPTAVRAVTQLMGSLTSVDLSINMLDAEAAKVLAPAIASSGSLTEVFLPLRLPPCPGCD